MPVETGKENVIAEILQARHAKVSGEGVHDSLIQESHE